MKAVLTRVRSASVSIDGEIVGSIGRGFLILLGVGPEDTRECTRYLAEKALGLRVFSDENGKMNRSLEDVGGQVLVVSQFTLYADCKKGNRPSFIYAGAPELANRLYEYWKQICIDSLTGKDKSRSYESLCRDIVNAFDTLPIQEGLRKPRVGIVGEILVKYMPLANNHLVELLEKEGAEAVVPDLMDFMNYSLYNGEYKHQFLGTSWTTEATAEIGIHAIAMLRQPAIRALKNSKRFEPPMDIRQVAELAKPFLSLGNQYGEGWFLTGEMAELITTGVPNIVCIQPFACLPNHVVGKGVIKALKTAYPQSNIIAVDYDPGASEVNQLNRIKLMLAVAREKTADLPQVTYVKEAMEDVDFPPESFDVVLSSLAFHYVEDFPALREKIRRWLVPGGDFVFSVEHPIFTARGDQDWLYGPGGEIDCFPVDNYFFEGRRRAVFLGEPVTKYHRTLTTYLDGLLTGGFALRRVAEPMPPEEMLDIPGMRDELRRPMMLLIRAKRKI